ncbi:MAG: PhoH family protein [Eubacteriales bacterium]|nr:PhoH family protein [Eubacteriales bacterium]
MDYITKAVRIQNPDVYFNIFGVCDAHLEMLQQEFQLQIYSQSNEVICVGKEEDIVLFERFVHSVTELVNKKHRFDKGSLAYAIALSKNNDLDSLEELLTEVITVTNKGKAIKCKTINQRIYVKCIEAGTLTFGIGPAGTGKTYLAMAMAVKALRNKEVEKIILTRPAVEAGEKLGFLPGDLNQKVDPYLRPLFDALYDFVGVDTYQNLIDKGIIEIAPLAYMRGRTLSNAFIILDEAQNTTKEQMKMFLTRFGFGSKVVVTGDLSQIDLPFGKLSGLAHAVQVLKDIKDISIIQLSDIDVVRNPLVQKIVKAYEKYDQEK